MSGSSPRWGDQRGRRRTLQYRTRFIFLCTDLLKHGEFRYRPVGFQGGDRIIGVIVYIIEVCPWKGKRPSSGGAMFLLIIASISVFSFGFGALFRILGTEKVGLPNNAFWMRCTCHSPPYCASAGERHRVITIAICSIHFKKSKAGLAQPLRLPVRGMPTKHGGVGSFDAAPAGSNPGSGIFAPSNDKSDDPIVLIEDGSEFERAPSILDIVFTLPVQVEADCCPTMPRFVDLGNAKSVSTSAQGSLRIAGER
jgi:hypothetical protein